MASSSSEKATDHPPTPTDTDIEAALPGGEPLTMKLTSPEEAPDPDTPTNPNIVTWDGPHDPSNPRNWPSLQKYINVALISIMSFVMPLSSSMFAPGVPLLMYQYHSTNPELASFVVSVFVLGFAIGPIFLAPLSELYGRVPIYHICNVLFTIFTVACGLSTNMGMMIAFRVLAGCAGSAVLSNGGGTISDLIVQEERGKSISFIALGPLLGPIAGPIAGGYLSQAKGWKWNFWVIAIASGVVTILCLIFMRETNPLIILHRKTLRLRASTGNPNLKSALDTDLSPKDYFKQAIWRPMKLLVFSPIVLSLSLFIGLCFGCLYLLFCTFTMVFSELYHWDTGTIGLSFIGMGVGSMISLVIFGLSSDPILKWKARTSGNGEMKPEYRLLPMIPGSLFIPIGLFWYGWAAHAQTHWIVPILGTVIVGIGYMPVVMATSTYLVDAFTPYAASALAANTILRSVMGAFIPMAGRQMYEKLGYGWGNSLLAFITTAMLPVPWLLYKYGERMRTQYRLVL